MNENTVLLSEQQLPVVWVVEDDPYTLRICIRMLEKNGYPAHGFPSAEELLLSRGKNESGIVLTDIHLPGISGKELLERLRKMSASGLQIIALGGDERPDEQQSLLDAGFDAVLVKPFTEQELLVILGSSMATDEPLSFTLLEQLVEDPEDRAGILVQFQTDTSFDLVLLETSITEKNPETAALYTHRMAGRFGQMGQAKLSADLRMIELRLWEKEPMETLISELEQVMERIREFLQQMERL